MIVDIICGAVVLLMGLFGYFSGFARQIGKLIAIVLGFVAALYLAQPVGDMLATSFQLSLLITRAIAFGLVFLVVTMVFRILWSAVTNRGDPASPMGLFNRLLGALLGAAKGGLLVYVVISLLVYAGPHLGDSGAKVNEQLEASVVAGELVDDNYIIDEMIPYAGGLTKLATIVSQPELVKKLAEQPEVDPNLLFLATHPKTQFLLNDPKVQTALQSRDWWTVLNDPRFTDVLLDADIVKALNRLELSGESPSAAPAPTPAQP